MFLWIGFLSNTINLKGIETNVNDKKYSIKFASLSRCEFCHYACSRIFLVKNRISLPF